jgi:hypothetical protein
MKKIFGLLIIGMGIMQFSMAQDSDGKGGFDKSKLFFGGGLGLSFGTYTIVNISPLAGYRFSELFAAGAGINYNYYGYNDGYWDYKQSYVGLSIFGRLYPVRQFFIQVQPQEDYMWYTQSGIGTNQGLPSYQVNQFVPSLLMGGGAAIPTGRNGAITISVMYDVLQNQYSPYYRQAVYGFGFTTGF